MSDTETRKSTTDGQIRGQAKDPERLVSSAPNVNWKTAARLFQLSDEVRQAAVKTGQSRG